MTKRLRITYGVLFGVLFLAELFIALFVHDGFVRPYIGDVLVTILLCCLCRTVIPKGVSALPMYVFAFAAFVELLQYINIVRLLGFENNTLVSTVVGTTFSFADLLCYAVGCIVFYGLERLIAFIFKK